MNTVETLHTQVWSRFLHKPYGIVLDYADQDGNAIIPTPEECVRSMPNPLGWWTPIENGAFFTGLYLGGLTEAFRLSPSEKLKNEILTLIGGLFRLQDVGNTPGFIARGVATDGTSHYPMGSDDQTAPWVYGLYKALQCDFLTKELRTEIKARLLQVIQILEKNNWLVPTEWEGQYNGGYMEPDFRAVARLLFLCRVGYEVSGDAVWKEKYISLLYAQPKHTIRTRLEICRDGFSLQMIEPPVPNVQFWINTCAQSCLYELTFLEEDPTVVEKYKLGLYLNGIASLPYLPKYAEYDNNSTLGFEMDWHCIENLWKPLHDARESYAYGIVQAQTWVPKFVPKRELEHKYLGNVLFGNWIAQLSLDERIQKVAREQLVKTIEYIDWNTMHVSYAFVAESAWYVSQQNEKQYG